MSTWIFLAWAIVVFISLVLLGISLLLMYVAVKVKRMHVVTDLLRSKPGAWWSWRDIVQGAGLKKSVLIDTMDTMIRIGHVVSIEDPVAVASQDEAYAKAERIIVNCESALKDLEAMRKWQAKFQAVQEELKEFIPSYLALKKFRFVYKRPGGKRKRTFDEKLSWLWPEAAEGKYQPI